MTCILFFVGTRPEFIKIYPLHQQLKSDDCLDVKLAYTGQHESIMDTFFNDFGIIPDFIGNVMFPGQSLNELHSKIFLWSDQIIELCKPDLVVVHGDTATASISALAAKYRKSVVAHIEAGLRTHDTSNPFPEEINRQIIGRVADLHFTPTVEASSNLLAEGVNKNTIFVVGNTIVDTVRLIMKPALSPPEKSVKKNVTITMHRRENHGHNIDQVSEAIKMLFEHSENINVFWVEHPNPATRPSNLPVSKHGNYFHYIRQMPYTDFIRHVGQAKCIITDSGGLQEEAAILGIPTLIIREATERPETIKYGLAKLLSPNANDIFANLLLNLDKDEEEHSCSDYTFSALGDGFSSEKIHKVISTYFNNLRGRKVLA